MEHARLIGFTVKALSNQFKRLMDRSRSGEEEGLTGMQRAVLGYVFRSMEKGDVFQRDIEKAFNIRRSTATGILQLLEKNGWIRRESVARDARLKRIAPTEKAEAFHRHALESIEAMERRITHDIPKEEIGCFLCTAHKLSVNMENALGEMDEECARRSDFT